MSPQLSIPRGSDFDLDRAIELLKLTQKAQTIHAQVEGKYPNDWDKWQEWAQETGPMPISVPGLLGDYDVYAMLGRAEFMWGRRKRVPFGFVAKKNNCIYVVFRGTATIAEWISNIRGFLKTYKLVANSGNAHRGFQTIYTRPDYGAWWEVVLGGLFNLSSHDDKPSMAQVIQSLLEDDELLKKMGVDNDTKLFVTGHSLGGALATLAALHISKISNLPNPNPTLYTFANPRAGDGTFVDACHGLEAYRIFNSEDLVPTLPLPTLKFKATPNQRAKVEQEYKVLNLLPIQSYTHVGEAIAFTDPRGTIPANHVIPSYLEFLTDSFSGLVEGVNKETANSDDESTQPEVVPV